MVKSDDKPSNPHGSIPLNIYSNCSLPNALRTTVWENPMKEESLESTGTQAVNYTRTATLLDLPRLCARTNRSPDSPNPNSLDTLSIRSWTRIPSVYRESRRVGHRFYDKKTLVVVTTNQRKGFSGGDPVKVELHV